MVDRLGHRHRHRECRAAAFVGVDRDTVVEHARQPLDDRQSKAETARDPRALLDELCRLGLAQWSQDDDSVALQRDAFVPSADFGHMLTLLADNVGDHLQAAVANILGTSAEHFEQAVYADELSRESVAALRPLIAVQWAELFQRLAPELERRIAEDKAAARPQTQRVRIGFYSFAEPMAQASPPAQAGPSRA